MIVLTLLNGPRQYLTLIQGWAETNTARAMRLTSACRVFSFTGTTCSLTLKYSHAFQNAACAEEGMTLYRSAQSSRCRMDQSRLTARAP